VGIWSVAPGPILSNSIYDGEVYDARLEKPGWDLPGASLPKAADRTEDGIAMVHQVEPPGGRLVSQMINPIKIMDTLHPKKISEPKPGVFVYDVGQNLAGWAELRVKGEPGTRVTLRFAESLYPDGTVNQENLLKAAVTDVYVLKGGEEEKWEPRFTYHGFRYVQLEGFPGRPELQNILVKSSGLQSTQTAYLNLAMNWLTESGKWFGGRKPAIYTAFPRIVRSDPSARDG